MTPKEKANELVDRFDNIDVLGEEHNGYIAQQCALVAVDEIRTALLFSGVLSGYWQEVYLEIEKL